MEETARSSDIRQSLMRYAARLLSARPYFSSRLEEKLLLRAEKLQLTEAGPVIDQIISDLKKNKFLDDRYLAEAYTRNELKKGWGPRIILLKLTHLGVDQPVADEVIRSEADVDRQKEAILHHLRKLRRYEKRVQINKLFQRGFNSSAIFLVFDSQLEAG